MVKSQIIIELSNGVEVVSIIKKDSAERLNLAEGKEIYAIVKASNMMVGID